MNIDSINHSLAFCGMTAYRQTLIELARRNNELQEQVEELQGLVSGEMMAGLVKPSELREVVEELVHGWRIERQPSDIQDTTVTTTIEDVDRQMAGVGRVLGAFQRAYVHSPGYPQNDEDGDGAA
jgi:hypothetical protein